MADTEAMAGDPDPELVPGNGVQINVHYCINIFVVYFINN